VKRSTSKIVTAVVQVDAYFREISRLGIPQFPRVPTPKAEISTKLGFYSSLSSKVPSLNILKLPDGQTKAMDILI